MGTNTITSPISLARVLPPLVAFLLLAIASPSLAQDAAEPPVVAIRAETGRPFIRPGEWFPVAVVLDIADRWHLAANAAAVGDLGLIATEITTEQAESPRLLADVLSTVWPAPVRREYPALGFSGPLPLFEGRTIVYVPVKALEAAEPGAAEVVLDVRWQACDDATCLMPETTRVRVPVTIVPVGDRRAGELEGVDPSLFRDFDGMLLPEFDDGARAAPVATKKESSPLAWIVVTVPVAVIALVLTWLFATKRL